MQRNWFSRHPLAGMLTGIAVPLIALATTLNDLLMLAAIVTGAAVIVTTFLSIPEDEQWVDVSWRDDRERDTVE